MKICSVKGCGKKHDSKGFCGKHYMNWKRHGSPNPVRIIHTKEIVKKCSVEGCKDDYKGLGYCDKHYQRFKKYGDVLLHPKPIQLLCSVKGCDKPHCAIGYCAKHRRKFKLYGNPLTHIGAFRGAGKDHPSWKGGKNINGEGYVRIFNRKHPNNVGGYVLEHRLVIEKILGRYLLPAEQVHHINKNRTNNNPRNLMLFNTNSNHKKFEHNKSHFPNSILFDGRNYMQHTEI